MRVAEEGGTRGAARWLARCWRALLAELVATALLVLLGVATLVAGPAPLTHPALAFGFVVLINAVAFGPVSGAHMNPAVTLAALLCGHIQWPLALAYALVQVHLSTHIIVLQTQMSYQYTHSTVRRSNPSTP